MWKIKIFIGCGSFRCEKIIENKYSSIYFKPIFEVYSIQKMPENMPNKTVDGNNALARELMVVRSKMRDRLMIEGNKPYYKVKTVKE